MVQPRVLSRLETPVPAKETTMTTATTTRDEAAAQSGPEALMALLGIIESEDWDRVAGIVVDDFEMSWPQSGERFSGRDDALAAMQAQDDKPVPAGKPIIVGSGDVWVLMMPLRYSQETVHYVGIFELEGDKLRRTTEYFAAPFPPKEERAAFVAR